jgi:hypothetical protein
MCLDTFNNNTNDLLELIKRKEKIIKNLIKEYNECETCHDNQFSVREIDEVFFHRQSLLENGINNNGIINYPNYYSSLSSSSFNLSINAPLLNAVIISHSEFYPIYGNDTYYGYSYCKTCKFNSKYAKEQFCTCRYVILYTLYDNKLIL